ncbi:hypothetical protein GGQ82_004183 [Sphingobium olei]
MLKLTSIHLVSLFCDVYAPSALAALGRPCAKSFQARQNKFVQSGTNQRVNR